MQISWFFDEQVFIGLEACEDRCAGARRHKLSGVLLTKDLKELHAAGAEVGASVNGVGDHPPILHNVKPGLDEIGMIGCLREVKEIEVFHL